MATLIDTPTGPGRLHIYESDGSERGTVILGHGAGGSQQTPDALLLAEVLPRDGWRTVLVDMPWRVAGRKVATSPPTLDRGWQPLVEAAKGEGRLVLGGRSAGARVACRTAGPLRADAVLCLSFPLHPPGKPERSRAEELATPCEIGLPVLVIQGRRDPFGTPEEVRAAAPEAVDVVPVSAAHSATKNLDEMLIPVRAFLADLG